MVIAQLLLIVAFVLFLLAAANVPSKIQLGWLGMALALLAWLLPLLGVRG